jgi:hypothetical protein
VRFDRTSLNIDAAAKICLGCRPEPLLRVGRHEQRSTASSRTKTGGSSPQNPSESVPWSATRPVANPDVTLRVDTIEMSDDGPNRVRISGVNGEPPPPTLKVSLKRHRRIPQRDEYRADHHRRRRVEATVSTLTAAIGKGSPQGLAASKALTTAPILADFDKHAEELTELSAQLFVSEDAREGMVAFLHKQPPRWVG